MNIDHQIDALLDAMGGFENRPDDQGGPVKYGVHINTLQNWFGRACTVDDLKNLDRRVAHDIYYSWYYLKPGYADLPPLIQPFMVDAALDCGRHCTVRFLQDALLSHGFDCGRQDGRINDRTLDAARVAEGQMGDGLLVALVTRRVIHYQNATQFDPSQADKLPDRIRRAESFLPAARGHIPPQTFPQPSV